MAKTIILIFSVFVLTTKLADAICCNLIKSQVDKKIEGQKTLCAPGNTLPANCCRDIANEVEKHLAAYEALCLNTTISACETSIALGMQSGKIPNNAITAVGHYNSNYLPHYGRLHKQQNLCSWLAPGNKLHGSWLQIDLGQTAILTGIATQGTCYSSSEWVKSYSISYSSDGKNWKTYREDGQEKILTGNVDKTSVVKNNFKTPFPTRFVRIWPETYNSYPTLRVELYGCMS